MGTLTILFSRAVGRLRGEPFLIDPRVGFRRLVSDASTQVTRLIRGCFRMRCLPGRASVGVRVTLKSRWKIRFEGPLFLGDDCFVDAEGTRGLVAGSNVSIQRHVTILCTGSLRSLGVGLTLGRNVGIGSHCLIGCAGGVEIGEDTILGNFVSIHSENHMTDDLATPIRLQGVTHEGVAIGKGCWIGAKVTILDGARIGDGVIVAAGAVVTRGSYECFGIYAGVPARLVGRRKGAPA